MQNIKIVGTSHIANESKALLNQAFLEFDPEVIALELDFGRLQALLNKSHNQGSGKELIKKIGLKSYLFYVFAKWLQGTFSKIVKTEPGVEMLEAVKLAKEHNKPILLIDQDINVTMRKLSSCLGFKFLWRMIKDIFRGIFKRKKVPFDIRKVPSDKVVNYLIKELKNTYPCLYKVLVDERNKYMVKRITSFVESNPDKKILVVVGAGHKEGMLKLLKKKGLVSS